MSELLLELFSEEIPARMQSGAARDLARLASEQLAKAGLAFDGLETFAGPRRLTLSVVGLPTRLDDRLEERKGPRVGAPDAALAGFLRSAGVAREALVERDGVWFATIDRPGKATASAIADIVPAIVTTFPWPKSMLSGAGSLRWVRPLHRVLCCFDGEIVPFALDGLESSDLSEGHRFMGSGRPFKARRMAEYRRALENERVVLATSERKALILNAARDLAAGKGLSLVEDEGLLEEVAGMVEWPATLLGAMDPAFLTLPPEVIRTSMRTHQRYFALAGSDGALAPHFIAVANIETEDGGVLIATGNARVLAARLSDARYFWDEDRRQPLARRLENLRGVTFHAGLGSMWERVQRLERLASDIAGHLGADPRRAQAAAHLAKADLATSMVGEFPDLQGVMGSYYAELEGEDPDVVQAIRDHYRPQGPSDRLPEGRIALAVALADKMDTVLSFFSIGERPTGSRDPFALRRAALGVIRIVLENDIRLPLSQVIAASAFDGEGVLAFFGERLKVLLRDRGARHDLVDAVFALGDDDLARVAARVSILGDFLSGEDGVNLLAAFRRAGNILVAEGRKGTLPEGPAARAPTPVEEAALFDSLVLSRPRLEAALAGGDYGQALAALAALRHPVDAFFDKVLVNTNSPAERDNRLRLLIEVRSAMTRAADFSLISG